VEFRRAYFVAAAMKQIGAGVVAFCRILEFTGEYIDLEDPPMTRWQASFTKAGPKVGRDFAVHIKVLEDWLNEG
jgi:hypothetical protein